MIEILKASAGSGKTFTLARKYIHLLLESEDRYAYRHILAVTFTNKATEEMKSRILKELHVLATEPAGSDYHDDFVPGIYKDDESLQKAAGTVLCNILHDYGAFAVSTIDKFFQQTLKAFSREIGQFASYQVELDRDSLISESVDRVLDSITGEKKDEKKLKWLTDNTISRLEQGDGYSLDYTLKSMALRLKDEEHRALIEKERLDESVLYSEETLKRLSEGCEKICSAFLTELNSAVVNVRSAFKEVNVDPYDTSSHFMSAALDKCTGLKPYAKVPMMTPTFMKNAEDKSKWFPKANAALADRITDDVVDAVIHLASLFGIEYKVYNTALLLRKQVYGFGIANDLHREFDALLKEKNVLSLDDSNTILKNIIDGTETPFIYEKMGVRYEHFLLDEFQDTAHVQWENFRPLLKNSIDSGFYNLIVGDVKQSIYRFRNSDWKLLRDDVPAEFGEMAEEDTLKTNWRSYGNIIRFNNALFADTSAVLDEKLGDTSGEGVISQIYADVVQKIAKKDDGGVRLTFCTPEDELEAVMDSIRTALSKGYSFKDIAVLVRGNNEGSDVASCLMMNGVRVVTDDSLMISSSLTVRRLVSLLSSIDNPGDSLTKYLAEHLEIEVPQSYTSMIDLCEELLRKLKECDEELFLSEVLYVQSFMDRLRDFVSSEGNNLHAFLKEWEGNKDSISSPNTGDAVRVMTIHKSKGLDFEYVIVPFVEKIGLVRPGNKWCRPDMSGTVLDDAAKGIYDVNLSSDSVNTLFASHYQDEVLMQYVDNVNILYVALTRAKAYMDVVAALPEKLPTVASAKNFAQIIYRFAEIKGKELGMTKVLPEGEEGEAVGLACTRYVYGNVPDKKQRDEKSEIMPMSSEFCSWPLNPTDCDDDVPVNERGRLKFSADSLDFFNTEGEAGVSASHRIKGIVLHDILSHVVMPDELDRAVDDAVSAGVLSSEESVEVTALLRARMTSAAARGWFPEDGAGVLNETELMDVDGSIYRPDRVVCKDGGVMILDYKFGAHYPKYERQLKKYADVWSRMGYEVKAAEIWYVQTGEIVKVL